jgi:hypothetical protein
MSFRIVRGIKTRLLGKVETPLYNREGYQKIFENAHLAVLMISGQKNECIISFTGVGHALGGIDLQTPEFTRSDGDETKVFIIDKQRSWGNNVNWDQLDEILNPVIQGAKVTTLGNSMGGFLAILSARRLGADRTIAFVPQWSIDPEIVPGEDRWLDYRKNIQRVKYKDLSSAFDTPTKFSVFFGRDRRDAMHLQFFPTQKDNLDLFVLEDCSHDAASFLKERGQLYPVIKACQNGKDVNLLLKESGIRYSAGTSQI